MGGKRMCHRGLRGLKWKSRKIPAGLGRNVEGSRNVVRRYQEGEVWSIESRLEYGIEREGPQASNGTEESVQTKGQKGTCNLEDIKSGPGGVIACPGMKKQAPPKVQGTYSSRSVTVGNDGRAWKISKLRGPCQVG